MAVTSKAMICNMALSHLGQYASVMNIDTPTSDAEVVFAQWYDAARQSLIELVMPNFAIQRRIVSKLAAVPVTGYAAYYEKPADCLRVLGIGDVYEKLSNNYTVEGGRIATDASYASGMPIRGVFDVDDPSLYPTSFSILLSWHLASMTALPITGDVQKANAIQQMMPLKMASLAAINAQESRPIRISRSNFRDARYVDYPGYQDKR